MRLAMRFAFVSFLLAPCHPSIAAADKTPEAPVAYFESVGSVTSAPASFYAIVSSVRPGLPAARAGLKDGDRIIGVDGLRVRDVREYTFVRFFYDLRPGITLTVVRSGQIMNISIPDPRPVRSGGFDFSDVKPDFLATLGTAGFLTNSVLPEPIPMIVASVRKAHAGTVEPLGSGAPEPGSEIALALASFPARGQEEMMSLLAGSDAADRAWAEGILKVYVLLLYEKRDEALKTITEGNLLDRKPKRFLFSLVEFYKRVAEHPVSQDVGVKTGAYEVDAPYFALCFPYPMLTSPKTAMFPADPTFEELFNKAYSGVMTRSKFSQELTTKANEYASHMDPDVAVSYIGSVKAAVLDPNRHGGWPFRSDRIWTSEQSAEMIVRLKSRLQEKPEEKTEIGLSLICPSMIAGDESVFRQALDISIEAGPRVTAIANTFISGAIGMRGNFPPGNWQKIAAADKAAPVSGLYDYLRRMSPSFARRMSAGNWADNLPFSGTIAGPGSYCFSKPFVVATAVERPVDIAYATKQGLSPVRKVTPAESGKMLEDLTAILAGNPDPEFVTSFLLMYPNFGVGRTFDVVRKAVPYHEQLWRSMGLNDGIVIKDLYREFFGDVERLKYRQTMAALAKLDNASKDLPQQIAELYENAGVPSTCLLMSKKLKEAGHAELASSYLKKAADMWDGLITAYPREADVNVWVCRDLASTPGFGGLFDGYAAQCRGIGGLSRAIVHVFTALVESYRGRYDAVVEHLIESNDPVLGSAQVVCLYNGDVYMSVAELRASFLAELVHGGVLSEDQISRLRAVPEFKINELDPLDK